MWYLPQYRSTGTTIHSKEAPPARVIACVEEHYRRKTTGDLLLPPR